jgi:hypothetical protein
VDVQIGELHSTVDAVDGEALLMPQTLERIVRSVLQALDARQRDRDVVRSEIDTRSIVEQQRRGTAQ